MYTTGQLVRFNPEYCTEQEQTYVYTIVTANDTTKRAVISCINSLLTVHPSEVVWYQMIEPLTMVSSLTGKHCN